MNYGGKAEVITDMVVRGKEAFCVHRKKKLSCLWLKLLKNGSKVKKKKQCCVHVLLSPTLRLTFPTLSSGDNSHLRATLVFLVTKGILLQKRQESFHSASTGRWQEHDNAAAVLQLPAEICWTDSKTFVKYESSAQQYVNIGNFPFCPSNPPDKNIRSETKIICLTISTMSGIKPFCLDI